MRKKAMLISPTDRLLLACMSARINGESRQKIKELLCDGIDWDYFVRQSTLQDVNPLIYHTLRRNMQDTDMLKKVISQLRKAYYVSLRRNLLIWEELKMVLNLLRNKRIRVVPLRGVVLSEIVYGNIGLRPAGDIDLLVQRKDLPKVAQVISSIGYRRDYEDFFARDIEREYGELEFVRNRGSFNLELNWFLGHPELFNIDFSDIWRDAVFHKIDNTEVLLLSPEDELLCLSLHIHYHIEESLPLLKLICDIAEITKYYRGKVQWDVLLRKAFFYKTSTALYYPFKFAYELLGASIPENVLEKLKPGYFKRQLIEVFFNHSMVRALGLAKKHSLSWYKNLFIYFMLFERFSLFHRLFMPMGRFVRAYSLPFPSKKTVILYYLRPLYLSFRLFKALIESSCFKLEKY